MKILLTAINAKYIHSNLALYSLKTYAKEQDKKRKQEADEQNLQIEMAEYTINHRTDYILQELYKQKPDILCFSCYIWNLSFVREIAEEFHKICPNVPIWAGGPEVSYETEQFLEENPAFFGVMIGEGESVFSNLSAFYKKQGTDVSRNTIDLEKDAAIQNAETYFDMLALIEGIAFRNGSRQIIFTKAQRPMNMDDIPFPYQDLTEFENRIIYYESSRGCPFRCSYCLSSVEKTLRFRSLPLVKEELKFFLDHKVKQVKFVDRTFNCDHEHAMGIWKFLKENDNGITNFHFEISADLLKEDEIAYLKTLRPGLIQLEIGVQSTNEATIQEIHRTMDLQELKQIVRKIKEKENIHQHLDLIAGLPFEDLATFKHSFDEIYALKPQQLQLGFLKVLKGSYMYEHAKEYELMYHTQPPYEVLSTKWLNYDKVLEIKNVEEMLEVYYNSNQFPMSIKILETNYQSAYEMFCQLGEFYEAHGYFAMKHTRIRRLEILLEFAREKEYEEYELLKQMAVFDLYSRENSKSRPSFAKEEKEWKEITHEYCKNGKMQHIEQFDFEIIPQETLSQIPRQVTPYYVLFDYANKDKLTNQALYSILNTDKEM